MAETAEFTGDPDDTTLADAASFVSTHVDDGVICPCCDRYHKRYPRKLNSGIAAALIVMYRWFQDHPDQTLCRFEDILSRHPNPTVRRFREHNKLLYWNLVTYIDGEMPARAPRWGLSVTGREFARNERSVSKHVYVLNNVVDYSSEERTTVDEALGNHFNYQEMMTHELNWEE